MHGKELQGGLLVLRWRRGGKRDSLKTCWKESAQLRRVTKQTEGTIKNSRKVWPWREDHLKRGERDMTGPVWMWVGVRIVGRNLVGSFLRF